MAYPQNITKDPVAAGRKGGLNKRGKKHFHTRLREKLQAMGLSWKDAEELLESNILEMLSSGTKKERAFASRYFAEYIKPKKKELSGEIGLTVEDYLLKRKDKE